MKAAMMEGPKQFVIKDVPEPPLGKSDVLIRVHACAICGSDLTMYKLGVRDRILGHEFSGEIVDKGEEIKDWRIGDRVVIEPSIVCGECYYCRKHQYNLCSSLGYTGLSTDGGFAEFARVPAYQLHHLPAELSYEQGALIEPLAAALRGVKLSRLEPGDSAAVFGCGIIGLFTMLWARNSGAAKIIATDVVEPRIDAGKSLADFVLNPTKSNVVEEITKLTDNVGPRIAYECSGSTEAQLQAINVVQKGGRVILLGIAYEPAAVMLISLTTKEIEVKGSVGYSSLRGIGEFPTAIESLRSKEIDTKKLPLLTVSLRDIGRAFEASLHGDVAKAIVIPKFNIKSARNGRTDEGRLHG
jgi:(R,R)-butanediol dehydrogenase/meso-butanediol dehydrogenase/diacetyl reductase